MFRPMYSYTTLGPAAGFTSVSSFRLPYQIL